MKIILRFIQTLFIVLTFSSCVTHTKFSDKEETFLNDSDFLRQKYDIQKKEKTSKVGEKGNVTLGDKEKSKHKADIKIQSPKELRKTKSSLKKNIKKTKEDPINFSSLFPEGERVVLSITYFGVAAGIVHIGIKSNKLVDGKETLHFYALGRTSSLFSLVYNIKDSIESLWSPYLKRPLILAFDMDETKQKYKTRSYFDWSKKTADYFEEGWHKKKGKYRNRKTWRLSKKAQDIVSIIFYLRILPLKVGETYIFNVMNNQKIIQAHFTVDRREIISTNIGKRQALVLKPRFKAKGKFKKVGDISVWVTDDEYKQILRLESEIRIGKVVAKVESITRSKIRL